MQWEHKSVAHSKGQALCKLLLLWVFYYLCYRHLGLNQTIKYKYIKEPKRACEGQTGENKYRLGKKEAYRRVSNNQTNTKEVVG